MNRVAVALVVLSLPALWLPALWLPPLWLPPSGGSTLNSGSTLSGSPVTGWSAVEQVFHQQAQAAGIVGSSVLLVRDGNIAGTAADGFQDLATKRAVDADTIFHWASITKTFTGIAIMQLRDRGLLSIDDPIV